MARWSRAPVLVVLVAVLTAVATTATASAATSCSPTLGDGFGPFGRGLPPVRAKIGTGHVLTGVVISSIGCRPLARASVEIWQAGRNGRYTRATSGTVFTDAQGRFRFEGPFPPRYEGTQPHIHLRVSAPVHRQLLYRIVPARGAKRTVVRLVLEPADL
jgi:protocatechuate 3,4-dioxygenase beta subunit